MQQTFRGRAKLTTFIYVTIDMTYIDIIDMTYYVRIDYNLF